jgi:hypothetical protein
MYVYTHVCRHVLEFMFKLVCMCVCMCVVTCLHTYLHTYIHTYIYMSQAVYRGHCGGKRAQIFPRIIASRDSGLYTYMHTYIHAYICHRLSIVDIVAGNARRSSRELLQEGITVNCEIAPDAVIEVSVSEVRKEFETKHVRVSY